MLALEIVRANRAVGSLPGGVGAREFAAREFPREDYRWVVAQLCGTPARKARARGLWGRLRRPFGTPGEPKTDPETVPESAPA